MGNNGCAFRIQPRIAVRVVEVPVGVDQMSDRITAKTVGSLQYPFARGGDSGVDEHLAIAAGQDRDITPGALEDAYVATQFVDLDGRFGGLVTDKIDDVACFRIGL